MTQGLFVDADSVMQNLRNEITLDQLCPGLDRFNPSSPGNKDAQA